jgi:endonuclease/exonuclease/phosphatase family metal-dependent hydrolase
VGVLYDDARFELISTNSYRLGDARNRGKPLFEARLRPREGGTLLRLLVVHLKADETPGDGFPQRRRQLGDIGPVLDSVRGSSERVVLLGDFNATGEADRSAIAGLSRAHQLVWASEGLSCTSYWTPADRCLGTPLDHLLSSVPARATARGPCETVGCGPSDQCPAFYHQVSDHCPVTIELQ